MGDRDAERGLIVLNSHQIDPCSLQALIISRRGNVLVVHIQAAFVRMLCVCGVCVCVCNREKERLCSRREDKAFDKSSMLQSINEIAVFEPTVC